MGLQIPHLRPGRGSEGQPLPPRNLWGGERGAGTLWGDPPFLQSGSALPVSPQPPLWPPPPAPTWLNFLSQCGHLCSLSVSCVSRWRIFDVGSEKERPQ